MRRPSDRETVHDADRRAAERFPPSGDACCPFVSPVAEDFGPARIKDISADGISLLTSRRAEVGTLLAVTLSNPARSFQRTVLVRVTHVTPSQGLYLVGGQFETSLRYDELTALVM